MPALLLVSLMLAGSLGRVCGADPKQASSNPSGTKRADGMIALTPNETVLLDREGKRLLVKTRVVLREGMLEMLCCPAQTKEHESILATDAPAYVIHTGLLALGAVPGRPVQYQPVFKPPTGQPIDLFVQWNDSQGRPRRVPAQDWVRYAIHRIFAVQLPALPPGLKLPEHDDNLPIRYFARAHELSWYGPMSSEQRTRLLAMTKDPGFRNAIDGFYKKSRSRPLDVGWVFAGSGYYVDDKTGRKSYLAEAGDLICVSNFPDAMLDLSVQSTDKQDEGLLFEAWTERVPPKGTEVILELVPRFPKVRGK